MRGNKPHLIVLSEKDRTQLQKIIRDGRTEQRVARRARILLAMENEQTIVLVDTNPCSNSHSKRIVPKIANSTVQNFVKGQVISFGAMNR